MNAEWCDCDDGKLIPAGVFAIYLDGRLHSPTACLDTDDLSLLSAGVA